LDEARNELAAFDYQTEATLAEGYPTDNFRESWKPQLRNVYVRIVDALQWPRHLSRREVVLWARPEQDPNVLLDYSPFDDLVETVSVGRNSTSSATG
jgi:hypothetical protein